MGTSSLRRAAQVRRLRPDLEVVGFRGNVETRLAKLSQGVADATFLACAGLRRLGQASRITLAIDPAEMLPAVAQGAVGLEIREGDAATAALVSPLDHAPSARAVEAERAYLACLEGSCRTPIAGLATLSGGDVEIRGEILSPDGRLCHAAGRTGPVGDRVALAVDLAEELKRRAGPGFFTA